MILAADHLEDVGDILASIDADLYALQEVYITI